VAAAYHQDVPRPADARRGDPAPWFSGPAGAGSSIPLDRVQRAFAALAPPSAQPPVHSAVLVPIVETRGEAALVLIRRSEHLVHDAGHIAFPGGHLEPGEEALAAALRESYEEIGLDPALVEVIGSFGAVERRRDRELVVPFVGLVAGHPPLVGDGREVAAILEVPLASLAADRVAWQESWGGEAEPGRCFFAGAEGLGRNLIWGLTARVIWDLLAAILAGA
jgi:8-oxo-dGTP pyrophosphatase MutT (NUDIX family)